jgi:hypothetical protein
MPGSACEVRRSGTWQRREERRGEERGGSERDVAWDLVAEFYRTGAGSRGGGMGNFAIPWAGEDEDDDERQRRRERERG